MNLITNLFKTISLLISFSSLIGISEFSIEKTATNQQNNGQKIPEILLERYFPDSPDRLSYEKRQLKLFEEGEKKLAEADKIRLSENQKSQLLSSEEKDAYNYFNGTGFYKFYQDPTMEPNIFDSRRSFLAKMQNPEMRLEFLNYFNNRKISKNRI